MKKIDNEGTVHDHRMAEDVVRENIDFALASLASVDPATHRAALEELQRRTTEALAAIPR